MFCYNCGCRLSEHDFCTACKADVSLYKKIIHVSNMYYNDGLEKAGVRDLSGAINSLRQSLKFNKNHIDARNLLGLVYFEMGEVVAALSEWVISKNLQADKNVADEYINMLQANTGRLDSMNQTIKKYNQALVYCTQDSKDLAIIQLKKVLSMNPKFVRAHQLLALVYMSNEQWERAQKELQKSMDIDRNNTMTLRYIKEVEQMLTPDENVKPNNKRKREEAVRYQTDNEIIIQPLNVTEPKGGGVSTLVNMGIGIVIGLAAMYFLVTPAAVSNVEADAQKKITEIGNQMDAKTSRVQELEVQVADLQASIELLNQDLTHYVGTDGTLQSLESLLKVANIYLSTQDLAQTADGLEELAENVKLEETSETFQSLYQQLYTLIGPEYSTTCYNEGYEAYDNKDYAVAIEKLSKAFYYDATKTDALYFLARAYHKSEDNANAIATYEKVIELFPDTDRAKKSKQYRDTLAAQETN